MQNRGFWRGVALYVIPLLLWMSVVFTMSTPVGSSENTKSAVRSILRRLFPDVDRYLTPEQVHEVDVYIRKGAHITEYTILGLLAYRAFRFGRRRFHPAYPAVTLLFGLLYAISDEWHQSFVPGREGTVRDVLFDMVGITIAVMFSLWWHCATLQRRLDAHGEEG